MTFQKLGSSKFVHPFDFKMSLCLIDCFGSCVILNLLNLQPQSKVFLGSSDCHSLEDDCSAVESFIRPHFKSLRQRPKIPLIFLVLYLMLIKSISWPPLRSFVRNLDSCPDSAFCIARKLLVATSFPVSYTHLTLPTSDLV